jgi:hypothetical protein
MRLLYLLQSISPGFTRTAIGEGSNISEELMNSTKHLAVLEPEEIANAVLYALGTPPHVQASPYAFSPLIPLLLVTFTYSLSALLSIQSFDISFFFF